MKKAGIITIHMINNYGALLQAYALNKYLRCNGVDAKTIDFRTYRVEESYRMFSPIHSTMDVIRNTLNLFFSRKIKKRNNRFHDFLYQYVPMTNETYYSNNDLEKSSLDFDYYICGSDQIWNTYCQNYDDAFILRFAIGKGELVSYAASLGADDINKKLRSLFSVVLKQYKAISVRETNAVPVIEKLSEKKVEYVADPVFLLDSAKWDEIASPLPKPLLNHPYVFFYSVKGNIPEMRNFVRKLSKQTGLPVVVVNNNLRELLYRNIKLYNAGPREFVSLIKNATYVITNSFHACAFSIIYKKKFLVFNASENGASRINSLLLMTGLVHRQGDKNSEISNVFEEIDYNKVFIQLDPFIEKSKNYLSDSLEYERRY